MVSATQPDFGLRADRASPGERECKVTVAPMRGIRRHPAAESSGREVQATAGRLDMKWCLI